MDTTKTTLLVSVLGILIGLTGLRPAVSRASSHLNRPTDLGNRPALQAVVVPTITKATIEKKDLIVEGGDFAAGATVLLNGTKTLKARNDDATPGTKLIIKKGRNSLPVEEVVSLQVKNPDGLSSEAIGFFTGLTLTYHNTQDGVGVSLRVGQIFLLNFYDPDIFWNIHDLSPLGEVIESLNYTVPQFPKAQGLFFTKQPGVFFLRMEGSPLGSPPFGWLVILTVQ